VADIVNLRQVRKQKARAAKETVAEQNRALHGRPKGEKLYDRKVGESADAFLEGHRRDPSGKQK
jgi:Domain of unknown function (DUF4169)